jgi:major vault protein
MKMAEHEKRPLMKGQFAWTVSKKDGKFKVLFGPDPLEATDDDIFVVCDPENPTVMKPVGHANEAIQDFITLKPDEYAVVTSPAEQFQEDHPNGAYQAGRQEMKALAYGQKRKITSGHFPLWPGQVCEIRKIHHLSASQYLTVMVESEDVDANAPFFTLTAKCANIKEAVVDDTVKPKDEKSEDVKRVTEITDDEGKTDSDKGESTDDSGSTPPATDVKTDFPTKPIFKLGQRIIIPGSLTPTYIPPTGIEIVWNKDGEAAGDDSSNVDILSKMGVNDAIRHFINTGDLMIEYLRDFMNSAGLSSHDHSEIVEEYQARRSSGSAKDAFYQSLKRNLESYELQSLVQAVEKKKKSKTTKIFSNDSAVREAVVLGPTQFCVLLDENGDPRIHSGSGRVFPGPYDRFREEGSRDRVYDAYHIRGDRGILIRIIADDIPVEELKRKLPEGALEDVAPETEDVTSKTGDETPASEETTPSEPKGKVFHKGDEIFIGGFDSYIVPSNSFEVINPVTRQPHVGNDHSDVYVNAIGVDQKSGVYVESVETGNKKLIKGEKKLLLDPRFERHVHRRVPGHLWNLMVGHNEPHKRAANDSMVETPWALSIVVPNNEAVLVVSKDGRRPVVGPCMELLEFDETLEILTLSRGKKKSDESQLQTCFLRVDGNRVTDQVTLETADKINITVDVEYGVTFGGTNDDERATWFNFKDYVMLLATNTRSRLRGAAQLLPLIEIDRSVSNFVRDVILGKKGDGEQHRRGLKFPENNMQVIEVEVIGYRIEDGEVSEALAKTNKTIVTRLVEDREKQVILESNRARKDIQDEEDQIAIENAQRAAETIKATSNFTHEQTLHQNSLNHAAAMHREALKAEEMDAAQARLDEEALRTRKRGEKDHALDLAHVRQRRKATVDFRNALLEIQKAVIAAQGKVDVDRLNAIQPKLVEAIEGLGNKQALAVLAENLPEAGGQFGFLTQTGGMAALKFLVKGTRLEKAIDALNDTEDTLEQADRPQETTRTEADE